MQKIWMVDPRGSPKLIDVALVPEKEKEGWVVLSQVEMTIDNRPKQTYYPAYDSQRPTRKTEVHLESKDERDTLKVEIY